MLLSNNLVYSSIMKEENYMDQIKIGKFIILKRKGKNITQSELAERLNTTVYTSFSFEITNLD